MGPLTYHTAALLRMIVTEVQCLLAGDRGEWVARSNRLADALERYEAAQPPPVPQDGARQLTPPASEDWSDADVREATALIYEAVNVNGTPWAEIAAQAVLNLAVSRRPVPAVPQELLEALGLACDGSIRNPVHLDKLHDLHALLTGPSVRAASGLPAAAVTKAKEIAPKLPEEYAMQRWTLHAPNSELSELFAVAQAIALVRKIAAL